MADVPSLDKTQLLRCLKAKLISILSVQPDFVLQHADSRSLITPQGYRQIKSCRTPDEKMRDLLDHIIGRGPEAAQGLLNLLKDQELLEEFPSLNFITSTQLDSDSGNKTKSFGKHRRKRKGKPESLQDVIPTKTSCSNKLVTEKQLMTAARALGQSWREVAIMSLEVPSVKLEQIVADNPSSQVNQVFAALRYWRNTQGSKATASHLHSLLTHPDLALSPDAFSFLLEKN